MAKPPREVDSDEMPEQSRQFFERAKRVASVADLEVAIRAEAPRLLAERRRRGSQKAPTKTLISLRLAPETVDAYRATGRGWQARMDADLAKAARRLRKAS